MKVVLSPEKPISLDKESATVTVTAALLSYPYTPFKRNNIPDSSCWDLDQGN
jgi:hypothetical protein